MLVEQHKPRIFPPLAKTVGSTLTKGMNDFQFFCPEGRIWFFPAIVNCVRNRLSHFPTKYLSPLSLKFRQLRAARGALI